MSQARRTLLIDSSGPLHRSFHGYPPRMGEVGGETMDVAALYGYLHYVNRLMDEFECERIIHVLDPEDGSKFRMGIYPEYKANRTPTDPRLTAQKQLLPQLLEATGQAYIQVPGVESDDVIACLAKKAREEGDLVLIVSSDKDLFQLVDDAGINVVRYVERTDVPGKLHEFYDEANVQRTLGVHPRQVADYLAIVGDKVDNIPGVDQAGPQTACAWLNKYGNLATLITNAHEVTGRGAKGLKACMDKLQLYQQLTTVLYEVEGAYFPEASKSDRELCLSALAILNAPEAWADKFGFTRQSEFITRPPRP